MVKAAHDSFTPSLANLPTPLNPLDWKMLWSLKIQHRLKLFLWKFIWNILPTRTNIFKFSNTVSTEELACPFCDGPAETLNRLFLDCGFARAVWRSSQWPINTYVFACLPVQEWAKAVINPCSLLGIPLDKCREFQLFALITMDHIWMARNSFIHGGLNPDPNACSFAIRGSLLKHLKAWADAGSPSPPWSPPPLGSLKVNFDVAVRPLYSVAAAGISNHNGCILAARSQKLPHSDVALGEASAALLAICLALSVGCSSLQLEGDSLLTILAINKGHLFLGWTSAPVIADCDARGIQIS
ncbi:hypothetical protein SLA2020_336400 [Shorea laevis]